MSASAAPTGPASPSEENLRILPGWGVLTPYE